MPNEVINSKNEGEGHPFVNPIDGEIGYFEVPEVQAMRANVLAYPGIGSWVTARLMRPVPTIKRAAPPGQNRVPVAASRVRMFRSWRTIKGTVATDRKSMHN